MANTGLWTALNLQLCCCKWVQNNWWYQTMANLNEWFIPEESKPLRSRDFEGPLSKIFCMLFPANLFISSNVLSLFSQINFYLMLDLPRQFPFLMDGVRQVVAVGIATANGAKDFPWVQSRQDADYRVAPSRKLPIAKCMWLGVLEALVSVWCTGTEGLRGHPGTCRERGF